MWIAVGIILVLVGGYLIYTVVVKKFPQLKLIDLSTMAKERHAQVKKRIMKDRFDRSMGSAKAKTSSVASGVKGWLGNLYQGAYNKLKTMEESYEDGQTTTQEARDSKLEKLLGKARDFIADENYPEAEKKYIDTLKSDEHNAEAYRGLADIYIAQKSYDQAKEVLEFMLKLNEDDAGAFERLGAIEAYRGNFNEAEERFLKSIEIAGNVAAYRVALAKVYIQAEEHQKASDQLKIALESEPYNPKYLDYFLEASILVGDVSAAEEAMNTLETANPENQKLDDFRERIVEMVEMKEKNRPS